MRSFVALNVIRKRPQKAFGVSRRDYNAALDAARRYTGHYSDEVHDEFLGRMRNHHQIGIFSIGHRFMKLNVELLVLLVFLCISHITIAMVGPRPSNTSVSVRLGQFYR